MGYNRNVLTAPHGRGLTTKGWFKVVLTNRRITAMVAHGHWEELAMRIRAALTNGLSRDEIKEILLQTAIYCGVPSANTAFKTAQHVFSEMDNAETDNAAAPPS